jgi:hypothetical protein
MLRWVSDLYNIGERRPGTPAGHRAERYVANFFSRAGLKDVHLDPISVKVWQPTEWSLAVDGFDPAGPKWRPLPCFYIPCTAFTAPEGVTGELIYAQGNLASLASRAAASPFGFSHHRSNLLPCFLPLDGGGARWGWSLLAGQVRGPLSGKILAADVRFARLPVSALRAIAYYIYDPEETLPPGMVRTATWSRPNFDAVYTLARDAGAIGFIGILADMPYRTNTYYAPHDGIFRPVPGLWLDSQTGAWLREELKRRRMKANLKLVGPTSAGLTSNIVGIVPGRTRECIIISCHHDSPFRSAVGNASGMAVLMALAKTFAPEANRLATLRSPGRAGFSEAALNRTLVFVASAGRFYGSIGTGAFLKRNRGVISRAVIEISIENIARESAPREGKPALPELEATGRVEPRLVFVSASGAVRQIVREAIEKHDLRRSFVLPGSSRLLGSHPPTDGAGYHAAGVPVIHLTSWPVYLLQAEDTLDKVASDQLVPVTLAFEDIIRALDKMPAAEIGGQG